LCSKKHWRARATYKECFGGYTGLPFDLVNGDVRVSEDAKTTAVQERHPGGKDQKFGKKRCCLATTGAGHNIPRSHTPKELPAFIVEMATAGKQ
jgi:hypothetical protein